MRLTRSTHACPSAMPGTVAIHRAQRRAVQEAARRDKALQSMTPRQCEVLLIRHGETDWNETNRLQGQLRPGPGLNPRGQGQARELSGRLRAGGPIDHIYCSDLGRAVETAECVAAAVGCAVSAEAGLRERALGSVLEGLTLEEARDAEPEAYAALVSHEPSVRLPGGGESINDLRARAAAALEDLAARHPGQRIAVVTHGGFLHAVHHRACSGSSSRKRIANCSLGVVMIECAPGGGRAGVWALLSWAEVEHLESFSSAAHGGGSAGV